MREHPILSNVARHGVRMGHQKLHDFVSQTFDNANKTPSIHIAGTNGKGSVSAFISSVLNVSGLKSGRFISPHLLEVNERISIKGKDISNEDLNHYLEEVSKKSCAYFGREYSHQAIPLTYFEIMTAVALCYFSDQATQLNVIEVGLGGRLDATNIINPSVSVITSIGFDHTEILGDSLASIASEKAGIIRQGIPVVVGRLPLEALKIIRMIALEKEAPIYVQEEDFFINFTEEQNWSYQSSELIIENLKLSLRGAHQGDNAAVALKAIELMPSLQFPPRLIREGLINAEHPGRLEWFQEHVLLDCAHNFDGASALSGYLSTLERSAPRTLLLGASSDKDIRAIAIALQGQVDRILTTHCSHPKAASAGEVATKLVDLDIPVIPAGHVDTVFQYIDIGKEEVIVSGSVFLVGAVRSILGTE